MSAELYIHVSEQDGEPDGPVCVGSIPETAADLRHVPDAIHLAPLLIAGLIGDRQPEVTTSLIDYIEQAIDKGHELTHVTTFVDGRRERVEVNYTMDDPEGLLGFLRAHRGCRIYTSVQTDARLVTNSLFLPQSVDY